jgi:predicted nucleotidyltransferase
MSNDHLKIYGLTEKQYQLIVKEIISIPEIEKVLIFGSRATEKFKPSSDIDLAVIGKDITSNLLNRIHSRLDDLPLPFMFDVINYDKINNDRLKEKIDLQGKLLFDRTIEIASG